MDRPIQKGLLAAAMAFSVAPVVATETPVQQPPEIVNVIAVANSDSKAVILQWSGGTPPFIIVRGEKQDFANDVAVTYLATGVTLRTFTDREALPDGKRYWYQVYDDNSKPEIFTMTPERATEGEVVTVRGIGFKGNCPDIRFMLEGGQSAQVLECSFMELTVRLPAHAVSGVLSVATANGIGGFGNNQGGWGEYPMRQPVTW